MQTQTVTISEAAHQLLQQLAEAEHTTAEVVIDRALENYCQTIRLNQTGAEQFDREAQLAAMAADEDIQRELRLIEEEFSITETDGLNLQQ